MFNIPILLISFNRPEHTQRVFEEIKKQKPKQLFVFQDGARDGNIADIEKCASVRAIFKDPLEWDCDLKTYYSNENLGCGRGPASGISWFFENVEQGIIIEDDAIPAPDFFEYAKELLIRYKDNTNVKIIGSMQIDGKSYGNASYYFSMMNRTLCAWATWKRTWSEFDYYLSNISQTDLKNALKSYHVTQREREYWCECLKKIHKDRLNESSWDIQLLILIWMNHGVGICPNVNLSTNIGFDQYGTHTINTDSKAANLEVENILPLKHPSNIKIYRSADLNFHKLYYCPYEYGWKGFKRLPFRINKRIKKIFKIEGSWLKNKKAGISSPVKKQGE